MFSAQSYSTKFEFYINNKLVYESAGFGSERFCYNAFFLLNKNDIIRYTGTTHESLFTWFAPLK